MLIHRLARAILTRTFFLVLCACAGQQLLTPAEPSSPQWKASLARLAANAAGASLEIPNHPSFSEFLGTNDLGEVAIDAGDGKPTLAYVARRPYRPQDFEREQAPNALVTTVTGLNNGGMIVGYYSDRRGNVVAFSERDGIWKHYADASNPTEYLGVNDGGIAVGFYTDHGVNHAFMRDLKSGKLTRIHPGAGSVIASAIDDRGDVVGYMTMAHGDVKGFLWEAARSAQLSYPGALETKPLGIAGNGEIVGTYVGASGKAHGFLLRDAETIPRWKAFDEPHASGETVLNGIDTRGDLAGYYRDKESRISGFYCCSTRPDDTPPPVIPVWGEGGDAQDTDPGAVPDQHLFAAIEDGGYSSNPKLAANCPGVSSTSTCQPYKYVDFLYDPCNTPATLAAYQWADANDETAFQHVYPNGTTSSNRIEYNATPNPSGPNCKPDNANAIMRMNAGDSAFNSYLYKTVWTGSNYANDFPAPYGAIEDHAPIFAGIVVGGAGGQVSTEYGSGTHPSGFANQVGNSSYHDATDWETALGTFVNGACSAICLNMATNSAATGSGNVGPCKIIGNGHCHSQYQSGLIDDQADIDNLCRTVTGGNLKYLQAERPIYAGRFGFGFLNSQTMTVDINTAANLYSHTSDGCATTKIVAVEPSYGPGGLGDIAGGYAVRLATLAYRWLVANPSTGIPDRVISFQLTEGQTKTEVPYFFEDTLVPDGAETAVPKFVWNGSTVTVGGGCPAADGDSGGAVALLAQCVGSAGIYCQQYEHLYIDQTDYGKTAACINTSTTTENITSSWFKNDPISSYSYILALQGGEMTAVPYQGVSGGSIALPTCTNKTYCTGQSTLATQVSPFKGNGSDQLCAQCGVILLENN